MFWSALVLSKSLSLHWQLLLCPSLLHFPALVLLQSCSCLDSASQIALGAFLGYSDILIFTLALVKLSIVLVLRRSLVINFCLTWPQVFDFCFKSLPQLATGYKGPGLHHAEWLIHMSPKETSSLCHITSSLARIGLLPEWGNLAVALKVFRIGLKTHKTFLLRMAPTVSFQALLPKRFEEE